MLTNLPAYSMRVFWSKEDEGFIAVCPELGGISAFGRNYDDAVRELRTAMELVVEDMNDEGEPLPAPYTEPEYSGQFRVRIPRSLHQRLVTEAAREGVSLNAWVSTRLAEAWSASKVIAELRQSIEDLRGLVTALRTVRSVIARKPSGANGTFGDIRSPFGIASEGDVSWPV